MSGYTPLRFLPWALYKDLPPLHLTLFVTRRCNARCGFCFYVTGHEPEVNEPELSLDEYGELSRSMGSLLWLAFSGGEIFLRDDLPEISRVFYRNNRPSIMLYPTNALMPELTRDKIVEVLEACPRSTIVLKISIDELGSAHDDMRGVTGAFEKVMQTYELLKPLRGEFRNFELGVNTVFCRDNQNRMDAIIDFVQGMDGIRTHTISLVRGEAADNDNLDPEGQIDMQKYLHAIERIEQGLKDGSAPTYGFHGARIKAAQDILQRRIIHTVATESRRVLPCFAGRLNLVVTESGDLYPCESFRDEHFLGSLRERWREGLGLKDILTSQRARDIISAIRGECFCTHECYIMTNILFNPAHYPALLKEYVQIGKSDK